LHTSDGCRGCVNRDRRPGQAVKNNGEDNNPDAADGGQPHIEAADAAQHHLAETANGDHRGDHHHRQGQHQRLVNPGHDGRHRQRS
jgi:hypothetical protein